MAEYQSYEFRALDRPIDGEAMAAVRKLSTRAEITPFSFSNEYHWGDFKGDPEQLVQQYYDLFVYHANWGTRWCIFKLPAGALSLETARVYACTESCWATQTATHTLVHYRVDSEDGEFWDTDDEWVNRLVAVRQELLAGDFRPLYIGWAAGAEWECEHDEPGPPVPPGLGKLTRGQDALAQFLRVDFDLLAVAAEGATGAPPEEPTDEEYAAWLRAADPAVKDDWLVRLLTTDPAGASGEIRSRFLRSLGRDEVGPADQRTVGELVAAAAVYGAERERRAHEKAVRERRRREKEAAEAREAYLSTLAGQEERLWLEAQQNIELRNPKGYDEAVRRLVDLRDLAMRVGDLSQFEERVHSLRELHFRKGNFLKTLAANGM